MTTLNEAVQSVKEWGGTKQNKIEWKTAMLGNGHGIVDAGNNMVYVRLIENSSVIQVLNGGVSLTDGVLVRIEKPAHDPLHWYAVRRTDQRIDEVSTDPGVYADVPPHHRLHEYLASDQVNIDWRQITSLRVYAYGGLLVGVLAGLLPRPGADLVVPTQTLDLTAHVPVSGAIWCLISVNSVGTLVATDSTPPVATVFDLTLGDIPDTPAGNFRLAAIRLYAGQTSIDESATNNDVRDLRWPQERLASSIAPGDMTLTNAHIFVGNVSNVAADVAMSNDATIANTGALTLKNTGPGATGPIGSATETPVITIDAQGRVTALSSVTIAGVTPVGAALTRGSIYRGSAAGVAEALAHGAAYAVLTGDGADTSWSTYLLSGTAGGKTNFAVTNAKTLTLTATDDCNLTIPATGTAALLGIPNVFTVGGQSITAAAGTTGLTISYGATGPGSGKYLLDLTSYTSAFVRVNYLNQLLISDTTGTTIPGITVTGNRGSGVSIGMSIINQSSTGYAGFSIQNDVSHQFGALILGSAYAGGGGRALFYANCTYGMIFDAQYANTSGIMVFRKASGTTNAITPAFEFWSNRASAATGFGFQILHSLDSSTTERRSAAKWDTVWVDGTDASRKACIIGTVYDTAAREWIRGAASGTAPMIGFLGATEVVRQTGDITAGLNNLGLFSGASLKLSGIHASTPITYISGTGTAGTDNTAQTVKTLTLAANTLTQVGDRLRIRAYWTGDTGSPITGSCLIGPSGSEVLVSHTTDGGAATLQLNEVWLHYIDNTHANIIENEAGALGALSAPNVAGFTWASSQDIIFTQDAIANNHTILYALIVDVFPKGV